MRRFLTAAAVGSTVLCLAFAGPGVIGGPASAAQDHQDRAVRQAVAQLPAYVKSVMRKTGVPGVAVAVVHRDRLVYAEGFGVRDAVTGARVTTDTVFQLASVSKPLGASAIAAAVGRGEVSWDTPAAPHVPGFDLRDAWVSEHVTIGDLYAHRSGLPGEFGNDLEGFGFGRQHILDRAYLEPLAAFRVNYAYSNFGLTAGGVAAANAVGKSWNELTRDYLFRPLGMSRSTYSHRELDRLTNVAALHQQTASGRWILGPERNASAQAPAGSANSTVKDIACWMRMMLAGGTFGGQRIVGRQALDEMLSLQIRTSKDPIGRIGGYGFGMGVDIAPGSSVVWSHSGAFSQGASTQIYLSPGLDYGIVTLTNGWPVGVPEAISATFDDLVRYGVSTRDWLEVASAIFAPLTTPTYEIDGRKRPRNPAPARPLEAYAGPFVNDYVGTGNVVIEQGRLVLAVGPNGKTRMPLRHWDGDVYFYNGLDLPPGFYTAVRFAGDDSGTATSMTIDEINSGLGTLVRPSR